MVLEAIPGLGRKWFTILSYINRKIETWRSCDMPQIVTKPKKNLVLQSGGFYQTTLKVGDMNIMEGRLPNPCAPNLHRGRFSLVLSEYSTLLW